MIMTVNLRRFKMSGIARKARPPLIIRIGKNELP